jgi:hypothetical protein
MTSSKWYKVEPHTSFTLALEETALVIACSTETSSEQTSFDAMMQL